MSNEPSEDNSLVSTSLTLACISPCEQVPTSAVLRSERVIVVDHGSDIFVWIGSLASSGPESTSDARVDKMKR